MKWGHAFYTSSSAAVCIHLSLCLYPHTLTSPLLLLQVFQLIGSLLAPSSDLNHLIGVSIWVTDWPCCSPVSLCNGWLYRQHNGTFINKAPPFTPSALPRHVSLCFLLLPAFYISWPFLLFVIHVSLVSPPPPPLVFSGSSIITLQRHAEGGGGVQWRRAPGDPCCSFQFTGCQVRKRNKNFSTFFKNGFIDFTQCSIVTQYW